MALPAPVPQVLAISGDAITVQVRPVPEIPTEIIWRIERNGAIASQLSLDEFQKVLTILQAQLIQARARSLNAPKPTP
jgi:hypothetical protein